MIEALAESDPGVEPDPLLGDAGGQRRLEPLGEEGADVVDDVLIGRVCCIVRGFPCMCISTSPASRSAQSAPIPGSPRSAVTSLTIAAPASSAASATASFEVSIETSWPVCATSTVSSSDDGLGSRDLLLGADVLRAGPRRLPPDIEDVGPRLDQLRPWAIAFPHPRYSPPSENESGVTFTTPIRRGFIDRRLLRFASGGGG